MITYIKIDGFKTFKNFEMYFSPFTVIVGVNAAGKSNLFDALALLSELASGNSIQKVLSSQRGELRELFTLFDNGKRAKEMSFVVEMLVNQRKVDFLRKFEDELYNDAIQNGEVTFPAEL